MKSLLLATLLPFATGQGPAPGCQAKLHTQLRGNLLTIQGHCLNTAAQSTRLRYELLTDKRGPAGTSRNTQAGEVLVDSQQDKLLSQTTINVDPADFYQIRLRLFNQQGEVVAADSLVHTAVSRP